MQNCAPQLLLMANFQSDDRSKIGRAYRICKIEHGSVITDGDISSQAKEVKMTVHIGFVFKYTQHLLVMATRKTNDRNEN